MNLTFLFIGGFEIVTIIVLLIAGFIAGFITGLIGIYITKKKGRSPLEGFLFGFFLSILGLIIVLLLPNKNNT